MHRERTIKQIFPAVPTLEGAGVHLKRVFGHNELPIFDPFLLLDDFHSDNKNDYIAGFPWHPHRGIETVTYMIAGHVEHQDSLGNRGVIGAGDLQWMTSGWGIVHQEMPKNSNGTLWGLQLWVNLPSSKKMIAPRYRDISAADIPEYKDNNGIAVKVIAGNYQGHTGPIKDIISDPEYLDIKIPPHKIFQHRIESENTVVGYVLEGEGFFDSSKKEKVMTECAVLYTEGSKIHIEAANDPLRLILLSGKPIKEPVAWYGPIVMNTEEELSLAFKEYREGRFVKD